MTYLLECCPALLVLHLVGQLPGRDLGDEPVELLLDLGRVPVAPVPFPAALKHLGLDPEREDLAPDVQVGLWLGRRRHVGHFAREELDGVGEVLLLAQLDLGEG